MREWKSSLKNSFLREIVLELRHVYSLQMHQMDLESVMNGDSLLPHFQQVRDTFFAVTGGQLQVLGDTFYLVGGHRFEGLYSANAGANNIQFYTNAIRKFTLETDSAGWQVGQGSCGVSQGNRLIRHSLYSPLRTVVVQCREGGGKRVAGGLRTGLP